jgi:hypothetical protein
MVATVDWGVRVSSRISLQDREQFVIRTDEVGPVAGSEPGGASWGVLEHVGVGPLDGYYPNPGRQVLHGHSGQSACRGYGQAGDQEKLAFYVEGGQDVQAQGGTDEPRGGEGRGRSDEVESKVLLDYPA